MMKSAFDGMVPQQDSSRPQLNSREDFLVYRAIVDKLASDKAGLSDLQKRFSQSAEGESVFYSWVGADGKVDNIGIEQLKNALDAPYFKDLASRVGGISEDQAAASARRVLPLIVSQLTPLGEIPSPRALQHAIELLRKQSA